VYLISTEFGINTTCKHEFKKSYKLYSVHFENNGFYFGVLTLFCLGFFEFLSLEISKSVKALAMKLGMFVASH